MVQQRCQAHQRPPFQIVRPNTLNTQNRHVLDTRNEACRVEHGYMLTAICASVQRNSGAAGAGPRKSGGRGLQLLHHNRLVLTICHHARRGRQDAAGWHHLRCSTPEPRQFHRREATCIVRTMSRLCLEGCKMSPSLQAVQAPAVPQGCTKTEWPHGGWLTTCHLWCLQASW